MRRTNPDTNIVPAFVTEKYPRDMSVDKNITQPSEKTTTVRHKYESGPINRGRKRWWGGGGARDPYSDGVRRRGLKVMFINGR